MGRLLGKQGVRPRRVITNLTGAFEKGCRFTNSLQRTIFIVQRLDDIGRRPQNCLGVTQVGDFARFTLDLPVLRSRWVTLKLETRVI